MCCVAAETCMADPISSSTSLDVRCVTNKCDQRIFLSVACPQMMPRVVSAACCGGVQVPPKKFGPKACEHELLNN